MEKQTIKHREIIRGKSLYQGAAEDVLPPTIIQQRETKVLRAGYKILVVNDRNKMTEIIQNILNNECSMSNVDVCKDGKEAFKMTALKEYDLILSSYRMNGLDGYKLSKLLKVSNFEGDFILVSGFNDHEKTVLTKIGVKILSQTFNVETLKEITLDSYGEYLMQRIINE